MIVNEIYLYAMNTLKDAINKTINDDKNPHSSKTQLIIANTMCTII